MKEKECKEPGLTKREKDQLINKSARDLSEARGELFDLACEIESKLADQREELLKTYADKIQAAGAKVRNKQAALKIQIDNARECFKRPKTREAFGLKLGLRKQRGGLEWEGTEEEFISRIKAEFGKYAAISKGLVVVTEKVCLSQMKTVDAETLEKLGAAIKDTGDKVIIEALETDADEMIRLYLG